MGTYSLGSPSWEGVSFNGGIKVVETQDITEELGLGVRQGLLPV
jgi:hypothetical protein